MCVLKFNPKKGEWKIFVCCFSYFFALISLTFLHESFGFDFVFCGYKEERERWREDEERNENKDGKIVEIEDKNYKKFETLGEI